MLKNPIKHQHNSVGINFPTTTNTQRCYSKRTFSSLAILLMFMLSIACSNSQTENEYNNAIDKLNETSVLSKNNLKKLSNLSTKTSLLKKKVNDFKISNKLVKLYFSQIESVTITVSRDQENIQKQLQIKLDEHKESLSSSLYKQKTEEINFLVSKTNKINKEFKKTFSAIQTTIAEIESILKQKLT